MQADFAYQPVFGAAGQQLGVTLLGDRAHVLAQWRDDAEAAGFRILHCCSLEEFAAAQIGDLGDLVLVDCTVAGAAEIALLSRIDLRAGKAGAQLVVSTGLAALDAVFGCFSLSAPQILIDPTKGERVIAIGRAIAKSQGMRVRELSDESKLMLLRLTEQVGSIAERLERLSPGQRAGGGAFRFESPAPKWKGEGEEHVVERNSQPALPDPAFVRRVIKARQARARFFDGELFADPAWDMLLDLTAARAEGHQVSVTSLCIASGVPATTALRWIGQMVDARVLRRVQDESDRRRAFIVLSDASARAMARYFVEVGTGAELAVA